MRKAERKSGITTQRGFTIIELIAILILVGILAATGTSALLPSTSAQLQSSRDQVVAAFFSAQQLAMAQQASVQLIISVPNQIDVQQGGASVRAGGVGYPIFLLPNQTIDPQTFSFDRLGQVAQSSNVELDLTQGGSTVTITVTSTGYVY